MKQFPSWLVNSSVALSGVALVAAVVACGQNTTLTEKSALEVLKDEAAQTSEAPSHPSNGQVDPVDPVVEPTEPVVAPVEPGPGGTTTVYVYRSGPYQRHVRALPLTEEEIAALPRESMPYIPTLNDPRGGNYRHRLPILNLGEIYGPASTDRFADGPRERKRTYTPVVSGHPTILDSQIILKLPFRNLPPRSALEEWTSPRDYLDMHLYMAKLSDDGYAKTEMMCFPQARRCSGSEYTAGNFLGNINDTGFFNGTRPSQYNTFLESQFLRERVRLSGRWYYHGELILPFSELLKTDEELLARNPGARRPTDVSILDLVYGDTPADQPLLSRDVYVVVADDSYVSRNLTFALMGFRVKDGVEIRFPGVPETGAGQ
ncbi:MAG: hypothetical protein IT285_01190 [Bdellovibrionales bacterium]|nr:hypothetical protein [Bdellovibrionales bacterium]